MILYHPTPMWLLKIESVELISFIYQEALECLNTNKQYPTLVQYGGDT